MRNLWEKKWFKISIVIFCVSLIVIPTIISLNRFLSPNYEFIEITKANQFKRKYHFPGSGSVKDPYIIEDLVINTRNSFGIRVTDIFFCNFIIRNCTIIAKDYAIIFSHFFECQASIINCTISSNNLEKPAFDSSCINLYAVDSIQIENNTLIDFNYGINAYHSSISISNNSFFDNSNYNIKLVHSETDIVNNTFTSNRNSSCIEFISSFPPDIDSINPGVYSSEIEILGNTFEFSKICIKISNWDGAIIKNNQFRNSTIGILLTNCTALIRQNQIANCTNGIISSSCNAIGIFYNVFEDNKEYAIIINGSSVLPNSIDHNDFIDNMWVFDSYPIFSQVYDSTNTSLWYEQTYENGNYWSDLSWAPTAVYFIDGGNCTDIHPKEYPYFS